MQFPSTDRLVRRSRECVRLPTPPVSTDTRKTRLSVQREFALRGALWLCPERPGSALDGFSVSSSYCPAARRRRSPGVRYRAVTTYARGPDYRRRCRHKFGVETGRRVVTPPDCGAPLSVGVPHAPALSRPFHEVVEHGTGAAPREGRRGRKTTDKSLLRCLIHRVVE